MPDWWIPAAALIVLAAVIGVKMMANTSRAQAAHNAEHGITADQAGNPHVEKMILSQSIELHLAAPLGQAASVLAQVRMPILFDRIGDDAWGDRATIEECLSYGRLEQVDGGTRARMLWCSDSNGMPGIEADWRALRKRLTTAARKAGITVTEHQGPRMVRVPIEDRPHHLRPEQAALSDHRWQSAEI